jgi:LysM repeat protein
VTAVVQPGDTLWSFAERNTPHRSPRAAIAEIRQLNNLEGYVIHPGQRLVLPQRR